MNTPPPSPGTPGQSHGSPHADGHVPPAMAQAFESQERQLRAATSRADALLARALASQPMGEPPDDFAASVIARLAASPAIASPSPGDRIELAVVKALLALLALGALVVVLRYGAQWQAMLVGLAGSTGAQWTLLGGACLGLSWLAAWAMAWLAARPSPRLGMHGPG